MQCPRCKKETLSDKECNHCGVVFEKFQRRLKTLDANEVQNNGSNIKKPVKPNSTLFNIVIVVSILLGYTFLRILFYDFFDLMHINSEYATLVALVFFTIVLVVVKWRQIKN